MQTEFRTARVLAHGVPGVVEKPGSRDQGTPARPEWWPEKEKPVRRGPDDLRWPIIIPGDDDEEDPSGRGGKSRPTQPPLIKHIPLPKRPGWKREDGVTIHGPRDRAPGTLIL